MSQALQTDVSVLSLSGGRRERSAPTVRIIEPDAGIAPAEGKGNLYVMVELAGPDQGRGRLYRDLLGVIQETYYYHGGDVASALTAAIRAAHAAVQQYNLYHSTHFTGGATCLAVTGAEIVSAQAGPTVLAVAGGAGLQWFSPLNNDSYRSLGDQQPPAVEIGRVPGHPGATIVVMNSAWVSYIEVPAMRAATATPRSQVVCDQLAAIGANAPEELNLIVVAMAAAPSRRAAPVAPVAAAVVTPPQPEPVVDYAETPEDAASAAGPAPAPKKRGLGVTGRIAAMGGAAAAASHSPATAAEPSPKPAAAVKPRKGAAPSRRIPYALIIVAVLALAILLITAGVWYVQGQQRAEMFNNYIKAVAVQYNAAQTTGNENEKRQYLKAAEEQLQQAAAFFPEHAEVIDWRDKVNRAKVDVNRVQELPSGFDLPLITFDPAATEATRVFVNGLNVYVLDTQEGQGKLVRYQLDKTTGNRQEPNSTPEVLIQTGADVGGRKVGEMAHALYGPAAGNRTASAPLALDRSNQLFGSVEGLGAQNVPLASNANLGFVRDMEFYNGNLYLLDTTNSQVWRYRPSGDSYTIAPEPYFGEGTNVNISAVIDSAIDGTVWLLYPNGTVLKYFNANQEAFDLGVIDPPIGNAVSMWVNEAELADGRIYIGDASTDRVLVFDKQGKLLSQLTPQDHPGILKDMRSIYVDETTNDLYVLTDSAVYQTPLPPIPNAT